MTKEIKEQNLDIKGQWLNVVRRLQSVAKTEGWAIVSINVLVDQDGCPRVWLSPTCRKIEPKLSAAVILSMLSEELEEED